ncbi:MAG: hypothetical protein IH998_13775, partial [Proteobacteria bacterium]|nr:hypothetical protein [Pseudomonadota bacterium]
MPRLPQALATGLALAMVAACTDADKHLAAIPDPAAAPPANAVKTAQAAHDSVV